MALNIRNNLKQTPIPVVPTNTPIVNSDGTVTRTGKLLLQQLQPSTTIEGTHANRPDAAKTPDGALYVESDRGALYYNAGGTWVYLAGTSWGTLSPDQRPTDLGVNDAGFTFRSVDNNPDLAPRTFVWSQTEWIETTLVTYGTHANRPAPNEKMPPRTLYVEEDRGNVIYQQQADKWMYLAGTFWGTLSPDQRPTDLGVNDAGFEFRSVDSNPAYAPRTFVWSQTAWVETTQVLYGTHAARPAADALTPPRTLYVETDRGNVIYQQQANAWVYLAGTMSGTISPDQRPTGLGANDTGFQFRSTDQPPKWWTWSGSAWVSMTSQQAVALMALATGSLTLTTTAQNIPGASLTLTPAGTWLVMGCFDFSYTGDAPNILIGGLSIGSGSSAILFLSANARAVISQQWLLTSVANNTSINLTAYKTGGTGSTATNVTHTNVSALWVSP